MGCKVLWENRGCSWEPVQVLRKDDPIITMAKDVGKHSLSNQKGWKQMDKEHQQEESQEVSTHDKGVFRTEEERSKVQVWYQCSTKCL